jgi:hypothetical protein
VFVPGQRDHQTDPLSTDTDSDGLDDGLEDPGKDGRYDPADGDTDPTLADTDKDGLADGVEDANRDGQIAGDDGNFIWDPGEIWTETDPRDPDTDDDGLQDGQEAGYGLDPLDPDWDADGLLDGEEVGPREDGVVTDPKDADSDADGLSDGDESGVSDPTDPDSDDDGLGDAEELAIGTDPRDPDSDDDRLSDLHEVSRDGKPAPSEHCWHPRGPDIVLSTHGDPRDPDSDDDGFEDGIEVCCRTDPGDGSSHPVVDLRVISATVTIDPAIALRGSPIALSGMVDNQTCLTISPLMVSVSGSVSGSGSISETIPGFIGPFETRRWEVPLGDANEDMELTFSAVAERVLNDPDIPVTEPVTSDNAVTVTVPVYEPFTNLAIEIADVRDVSLFGAAFDVRITNRGGTHHDGQTKISTVVTNTATGEQIGGVPWHLIDPPVGELKPLGDAVVRTVGISWPGSGGEAMDVQVEFTATACQEDTLGTCTPREESSLNDNTVTQTLNLTTAREISEAADVSIVDVHAEEEDSPWWPMYEAGAGNEAQILVGVRNDGLHAGYANLRVEMQAEDGGSQVVEDGEVLIHYAPHQTFGVPFTGTVTMPRGTSVTFTMTLTTLSGSVLVTRTVRQPLYHVDAYVRADATNFFPFDPPSEDVATTLVVPLGNLGNVRSMADIPVHLYFGREPPAECGPSPDAQTEVALLRPPHGGAALFDLVPQEKGTFSATVQVCDRWNDNNAVRFDYEVETSRQLYGALNRGEPGGPWGWRVPPTPVQRNDEDPFTVFIWDIRDEQDREEFTWEVALRPNGDATFQTSLYSETLDTSLTPSLERAIKVSYDQVGVHELVLLVDESERDRVSWPVIPRLELFNRQKYEIDAGEDEGETRLAGWGDGDVRTGSASDYTRAWAEAGAVGAGTGVGFVQGGEYIPFWLDAGEEMEGSRWLADLEIEFSVDGTVNTAELDAGVGASIVYYFVAVNGGVAERGWKAPDPEDVLANMEVVEPLIYQPDLEIRLIKALIDGLLGSVCPECEIALSAAQWILDHMECNAVLEDETVTFPVRVPVVAGDPYSAYLELDAVAAAGAGLLAEAYTFVDFGDIDNCCDGPDDGLRIVSVRLLDAVPQP